MQENVAQCLIRGKFRNLGIKELSSNMGAFRVTRQLFLVLFGAFGASKKLFRT